MTQTDVPDDLRAAAEAGDWKAALAALNARTAYRFTAMHRFKGDCVRVLTFHDRLDPAAGPPEDVPVEASYCVYVRDGDDPFHVRDALADLRVEGHPRCREVRAYYGVPLLDADGATVGTLCHFDTEPACITEEDVRLMEWLAALVSGRGVWPVPAGR